MQEMITETNGRPVYSRDICKVCGRHLNIDYSGFAGDLCTTHFMEEYLKKREELNKIIFGVMGLKI